MGAWGRLPTFTAGTSGKAAFRSLSLARLRLRDLSAQAPAPFPMTSPRFRPRLVLALLLAPGLAALPVRVAAAADLYAAPDGSAEAPGTLAAPTTLERALTLVPPGGTVHLRGGTYAFDTQLTIARDNAGTGPQSRKHLVAYTPPGSMPERPRLDFSRQPYAKKGNPRGLQIDGHWWHVRGLDVFGSADNGIYVAGSHNLIERCVTHHNRDTGLQIGRHAATDVDPADWPAHNLILNCESHDNHDSPPGAGENADGFACKLTSGPGNVFRGCVAHHNIDDGWDLFTKPKTGSIGAVVLDQCIAYANGTLSDGSQNAKGDRNGFKLGGSGMPVAHVVTRCLAFANGKNGFTWNSNPGAIRLFNNLAWDNAQGNYKFDAPAAIFLNNLSLFTAGPGKSDRYGGANGRPTGDTNIFWSTAGKTRLRNDRGLQVSPASFVSLSLPAGGFARLADGSLDLGDFARLAPGSPLIDAGALPDPAYRTELPYDPAAAYEGAPDLGAREAPRPPALAAAE